MQQHPFFQKKGGDDAVVVNKTKHRVTSSSCSLCGHSPHWPSWDSSWENLGLLWEWEKAKSPGGPTSSSAPHCGRVPVSLLGALSSSVSSWTVLKAEAGCLPPFLELAFSRLSVSAGAAVFPSL